MIQKAKLLINNTMITVFLQNISYNTSNVTFSFKHGPLHKFLLEITLIILLALVCFIIEVPKKNKMVHNSCVNEIFKKMKAIATFIKSRNSKNQQEL